MQDNRATFRFAGTLAAIPLLFGCGQAEFSEDTAPCYTCDEGGYAKVTAADNAIAWCELVPASEGSYQVSCDVLASSGVRDGNWADLAGFSFGVYDANDEYLFGDSWSESNSATLTPADTFDEFPVTLEVSWNFGLDKWGYSLDSFSTEISITNADAQPVLIVPPYDVWSVQFDAPNVKPAGVNSDTRIRFDFPVPQGYEYATYGEGGMRDIESISTYLGYHLGSETPLRVPRDTESIHVDGTAEETGGNTYPVSLDINGPGLYKIKE